MERDLTSGYIVCWVFHVRYSSYPEAELYLLLTLFLDHPHPGHRVNLDFTDYGSVRYAAEVMILPLLHHVAPTRLTITMRYFERYLLATKLGHWHGIDNALSHTNYLGCRIVQEILVILPVEDEVLEYLPYDLKQLSKELFPRCTAKGMVTVRKSELPLRRRL